MKQEPLYIYKYVCKCVHITCMYQEVKASYLEINKSNFEILFEQNIAVLVLRFARSRIENAQNEKQI